jgi:hypothetical protein
MLLAFAATGAAATAHAEDPHCAAKATALVDALARGDYPATQRYLGGFMRLMLNPEQMRSDWESLTHDAGAYLSHGDAGAQGSPEGQAIVRVPLAFAHGAKTLRIICDAARKGAIVNVLFQ